MLTGVTESTVSYSREGAGEYPVFSLDQWAPYAAFSSIFDKDSGAVDAGYAVDVWRPTPFYSTTDVTGSQVGNIFSGIDVGCSGAQR